MKTLFRILFRGAIISICFFGVAGCANSNTSVYSSRYSDKQKIEKQKYDEALQSAGSSRAKAKRFVPADKKKQVRKQAEEVKVDELDMLIRSYQQTLNLDTLLKIARRVTKNPYIRLTSLYSAPNPYAFDTGTIYYCNMINVVNTRRGRMAAINSYVSDDGTSSNMISIRTLSSNFKSGMVTNAFLEYAGTTTLLLDNGSSVERPSFYLVFNF